jgi:hypothetical protein
MLSFVALAGLMGHALTMFVRGQDASSHVAEENDEPSIFWTSERFNQSGEGSSRPYFPE